MTSSISKPLLRELSAEERAAWSAQNIREEQMRDDRFGRMTFLEKLRALESRGREMAALRDRALQRQAEQTS
jgi:hypothetical protein